MEYRNTNKEIVRNIIIGFLVYSLLLLFVGRNLSFIPQIHFESKMQTATSPKDLHEDVLKKFFKSEKGTYSIYYKDIKTGQEFGIDENKIITAASLNKVPIVAYLYHEASLGKIDLEDTVSIQEDDIQDYGTGSLRYQKPGGTYSLKTLTKLALEQSDNTAAHVLGVRLDLANVQKYINSLGFVSTNVINDKTTAKEIGKMFDLIYRRKVANEALTRELLDFMHDTDFEDRLPRYLPKNTTVYHKVGDAIGKIHDAGVIVTPDKDPFVLSVMTTDISDEGRAKQTIGKIAEFVNNNQ